MVHLQCKANETKFWRLIEPEYESDYHSTFINGSLEHPFGLPGIKCEMCGTTWSGIRVLPYPCPSDLQHKLRDVWPISSSDHRALRNEVVAALNREGHSVDYLRPGDELQPAIVNIPSQPKADFLWASLGSVLVAQRIRGVLTKNKITGVNFCPVTYGKIGRLSPDALPPILENGEPEDMLEAIEPLSSYEGVGNYYEMVVVAESGKPLGGEVTQVCVDCGRETIDNTARQLEMRLNMWKGQDIFFLATTLWIVITDKVKQILEELDATNIQFKPL